MTFYSLPYLDQAMRVWGHRYGLAVALMDADTVSETNCIRQPFSASDIGQDKATVLINRINLFWGADWQAVPNHFHAKSLDRNRDRCPDVVIGCVDTRAARRAIEDSFSHALNRACYWLDLGNNAAGGIRSAVEHAQPQEGRAPAHGERTLPGDRGRGGR